MNTLLNTHHNRKMLLIKMMVMALVITTFAMVFMAPYMDTFAAPGPAGGGSGGGAAINQGGVQAVMEIVKGIVSTAGTFGGIIIVIWGVFQMIMAMRREDSEAISKQVITIVVGGVLVGFGQMIGPIIEAVQP